MIDINPTQIITWIYTIVFSPVVLCPS